MPSGGMLRDKLIARIAEMGAGIDHQRLVAEVLGIRGAPPELARKLVAQALVIEDRRDAWQRAGVRICREAPSTAGVYIFRDADGRTLYVGKAVNLRRRLRAHFAARRWRGIKPALSRVTDAEWIEVGSELEALLREAALIAELQPIVNVQTGAPHLGAREVPRALVRDVIVVVPSIEADSVELVAARADGGWRIQRTRRSGADLAVHAARLLKFFRAPDVGTSSSGLGPIVFSWLAHRGSSATRLDPGDVRSSRDLSARLAAILRDERLFHERLQHR
ncbi:MAG TPA: nucleotide excision repair endonuclease [Vicinamibacterales bacterium]|nr:nucleotide excision repair endonuclease [Vicinamibacterales bacterium]